MHVVDFPVHTIVQQELPDPVRVFWILTPRLSQGNHLVLIGLSVLVVVSKSPNQSINQSINQSKQVTMGRAVHVKRYFWRFRKSRAAYPAISFQFSNVWLFLFSTKLYLFVFSCDRKPDPRDTDFRIRRCYIAEPHEVFPATAAVEPEPSGDSRQDKEKWPGYRRSLQLFQQHPEIEEDMRSILLHWMMEVRSAINWLIDWLVGWEKEIIL